MHVMGSADDIEYFDNGRVGRSGDDWFRLDFASPEASPVDCLFIDSGPTGGSPHTRVPDRSEAAREIWRVHSSAGRLLPIVEYTDGKNENERNHQQQEQHRIAVNRNLQPGETYFLRVEANSPGYDLELRVVQAGAL